MEQQQTHKGHNYASFPTESATRACKRTPSARISRPVRIIRYTLGSAEIWTCKQPLVAVGEGRVEEAREGGVTAITVIFCSPVKKVGT